MSTIRGTCLGDAVVPAALGFLFVGNPALWRAGLDYGVRFADWHKRYKIRAPEARNSLAQHAAAGGVLVKRENSWECRRHGSVS